MQHAATLRPFAAGATFQRAQRRPVAAAGSGNGAAVAQLAEGSRIRVVKPIKVFHAPKYKAGLDLEGKEGVVVQPDVTDYKHHDGKRHQLSANLPVKVQFMVPPPTGEGKDIKVLAHLTHDEIEAL